LSGICIKSYRCAGAIVSPLIGKHACRVSR